MAMTASTLAVDEWVDTMMLTMTLIYPTSYACVCVERQFWINILKG